MNYTLPANNQQAVGNMSLFRVSEDEIVKRFQDSHARAVYRTVTSPWLLATILDIAHGKNYDLTPPPPKPEPKPPGIISGLIAKLGL